jgi:hypothetical protein
VTDHNDQPVEDHQGEPVEDHEHLRLILPELDRQLEEIRETADGLASRTGVLLGASIVSVAFLADTFADPSNWAKGALVAFGVAVLAGIGALLPAKFILGPETAHMEMWRRDKSATTAPERYRDAKSNMVRQNSNRLKWMNRAVYVQCFAVAVAVILAITSIWNQ